MVAAEKTNKMRSSLLVVIVAVQSSFGLDNGVARSPPMGWRSWNLFAGDVNQSLMMSIMDEVVKRERSVDGVPTSLLDLGFSDVGLDDGWQECGAYGSYSYHSAEGVYPIVNRTRFPDFVEMTSYAHEKNLTAGWYLNNCICQDSCGTEECYRGDAGALLSYGFDSVKLDNCGAQTNLDLWSELFNTSVTTPIVIENCHWGHTLPNATWCPFHFYRSSIDIKPYFDSVLHNLETVFGLADQNLSTPGCWAYPDMLEIGVADFTPAQARSHYASWAIVSSPLTLSLDLRNQSLMDDLWPLIANPEIIAVNQAWAGFSGSKFYSLTHNDATVQFLYKPLMKNLSTAVLLMNTADSPFSNLTLAFASVPTLPCAPLCQVRDIFNRSDLGTFADAISFSAPLQAYDSIFLLLSLPS